MTKGAMFKKADLHLHLPGKDQQYNCGGQVNVNSTEEREAFAERFVQQAHDGAGLEIIAVTCHNDASWVEVIHRAAKRLYGDGLAVFPGVEIGTHSGQDGIHLLALFDIGTPQERLDEFLLALKLDSSKRFNKAGQPRNTDLSFPQVLEMIHHPFQGIAIAPHVFSDNGMLNSQRQSVRIADFTNPLLLAVDFKSTMASVPPKGLDVLQNRDPDLSFRRKRPIACLNSSDARSLDEIGTWYTWIKCDTVNLESLKQALLDPEARLRLRDDPPPEPPYQIRNVHVEETGSGFLQGLDLPLNPRINCLIGGRGTGKSAIVELVRYLWEKDPVPDRQEEVHRFLPVFLPESGRASVNVRCRAPDGTRWIEYRLERAGRAETRVYRLQEDGTSVLVPDLRPQDVFPIAVFGQKEVLYTSRDQGTQLQMLDRMIGQLLDSLNGELGVVDLQLRRNRERMVGHFAEVAQLQEKTYQLGRIREQLRHYRQAGLEGLERNRQMYDREAGLWETAESQITNMESGLRSARGALEMDRSYLSDSQLSVSSEKDGGGETAAKHLPNRQLFVALRKQLSELSADVTRILDRATQRLQVAQGELRGGRHTWEQARQAFDEQYQKQMHEVGGESFDLDTLLRLEAEKSHLERLQREVSRLTALVVRLAKERVALLKQREELVEKRFKLRKQYAKQLTERLRPSSQGMVPRVRVRVVRSGDQDGLVEQLRTFLTGSRLRQGDYESIVDCAAEDLLGFLACLEAVDTRDDETPSVYGEWLPERGAIGGRQQVLVAHDSLQQLSDFCALDRDKARRLADYLGQERRLELDEYVVPDRVAIEVNIARDIEVGKAANRQPIWRSLGREIGQGVSVGQGCTAVLSIILLQSQSPLLIDQPEDDLDNRFIYDEIVQLLRRERGQRQMIIATHNANIPVAGDAELIHALGVEQIEQLGREASVHCSVEGMGFIDADHMRQIVSETLEGGQQAFEMRKEKYGF